MLSDTCPQSECMLEQFIHSTSMVWVHQPQNQWEKAGDSNEVLSTLFYRSFQVLSQLLRSWDPSLEGHRGPQGESFSRVAPGATWIPGWTPAFSSLVCVKPGITCLRYPSRARSLQGMRSLRAAPLFCSLSHPSPLRLTNPDSFLIDWVYVEYQGL